jgi:hypothetical protein
MALTWDQVSAITSKKFIPKVVDNIFDSNPMFERFRRKNLMKLDGGTSIMVPLNYAKPTASGWFSGSDTLDVADNDQISAAEYDWKQGYTAVNINRLEELKNSGDAAKVSLSRAKMEIAQKNLADLLGVAMWNDGSSAKNLHGLRHLLSTSNTVGGISQSTNSWWQAQVDSSTTVLTISALQTQFTAASIGNDTPSVGFCTRSLYDLYYNLLQPQQRFADKDTARGGFSSLMFNGIPIIADSQAPANHLCFLNEKYIMLKAHKDEFFRMEPWAKPINQSLRVAKVYFAGNLCSSNNRMHALFSAITS